MCKDNQCRVCKENQWGVGVGIFVRGKIHKQEKGRKNQKEGGKTKKQ
jgi:hypothetical protein